MLDWSPQYCVEIFETCLRDNVKAREQDSEGNYFRVQPAEGEPRLNSQIYFYEQAYKAAEQAQSAEKTEPKDTEIIPQTVLDVQQESVGEAASDVQRTEVHRVKIRRVRR